MIMWNVLKTLSPLDSHFNAILTRILGAKNSWFCLKMKKINRPNSKGSGYLHLREAHKNQGKYISYIGIYLHIHLVLTQILYMLPRIIRYFRCNIFFWQLFSKFTLSCGFILHYTHFEDKSPKGTKGWFPNSCGGSRYLRQAFTSPLKILKSINRHIFVVEMGRWHLQWKMWGI